MIDKESVHLHHKRVRVALALTAAGLVALFTVAVTAATMLAQDTHSHRSSGRMTRSSSTM